MENRSTISGNVMILIVLSFGILFQVITFSNVSAQCSVVGSGTVTGNVNFGSSNNWANPNRATVSDDLHSRVQLSAGEISKYLSVSDFGYVIPPAAIIDGIEVKIEGHQESFVADFADASIMITQNGLPVGTDHAGTGYYDDKDYVNVYGSATDLWGTSWTPADIMDPGFGVLYSVTRNSGDDSYYMYVDYVEVTVYFSGDGCILPVTYKAYDVVLQADHTVKLNWTTATETNSAFYEIERSHDGVNFTTIGALNAQGNSAIDSDYSFIDEEVLQGSAYYRLLQFDLNGSAHDSEVRTVNASSSLEVNAYPNPATTQLVLSGNLAGAMAKFYDVTGKMVLQQPLENQQLIDVSALPDGIYVLQVANASQSSSQRIVIR